MNSTRKRLLCACLGAGLAAAPATAQAALLDVLGEPLSSKQLSELRGGMRLGQLQFDISVVVESRINSAQDNIGLRTELRLDELGQIGSRVTEVISSRMAPPIVTETDTGSVTVSAPPGDPVPSPSPSASPSPAAPPAAEIPQQPPVSEVTHNVTGNSLQTIIRNTVNNVTIDNSRSVNIVAPNFIDTVAGISAVNRVAGIADNAAQMGLGR